MSEFDRPPRAFRPSSVKGRVREKRKRHLDPSTHAPSDAVRDELERRLLADQARVQAELAGLNERQGQLQAKTRTPRAPELVELGKRVREHRLSLGFSALAYARSLGVSESAIHKIELGLARPSGRLCGLLADAGVDVALNESTEGRESC